jgi:hypothetical protein
MVLRRRTDCAASGDGIAGLIWTANAAMSDRFPFLNATVA